MLLQWIHKHIKGEIIGMRSLELNLECIRIMTQISDVLMTQISDV